MFGGDEASSGATAVFDYLARASATAHHRRPSATRSTRHAEKLLEQVAAQLRGGCRGTPRAVGRVTLPAPDASFVDWESVAPVVRARRDRAVVAAEATALEPHAMAAAGVRHIACQPAVEFHGRVADWVAEIRRLRERRRRRCCSSPRRRAAPSARSSCSQEYDVLAVPVERAEDARTRRCSSPSAQLSRGFRLPDAGAADLRRGRRLRGRAPRARAAAVGDQGVPLRPPRSQGRRPRRPRRPRHRRVRRPEADRRRRQRRRSSSSCATPATTSCSSRSSGSISSRSTPARRRPPLDRLGGTSWERAKTTRQEGDARHGRGAAQALRRAQGRARPRLQPPTRTGSRSSRTRSSTS